MIRFDTQIVSPSRCWVLLAAAACILLPSSSIFNRHRHEVEAFLMVRPTKEVTSSSSSTKTILYGQRMKFQSPQRVVSQTEIIECESDGSDAWKTMDLVDILQRGGVGVLPTDTGYAFVTPLESKNGLERLFRLKDLNMIGSPETPLSILCSKISTIDKYCLVSNRRMFKTLKSYLPGPYTFLLPSKTTNRGMLFDSKGHKYLWKRQTLGVCIPDDPILRYLQDELLQDMPLVMSPLTLTTNGDDDIDDDDVRQLLACSLDTGASWGKEVDFIVNAGPRPFDGSTVYDMTFREPELVREGLGDLELVA